MSILEGVGLQFEESMSGYLGIGETDPCQGAVVGKHHGTAIRFEVHIRIDDLNRFLKLAGHTAALAGTVVCEPLGGTHAIRDGRFNLFSLDPATGMRQMVYSFTFTAADGQPYFFWGQKAIHDDPGKLDIVEDMTRLFAVVYRGEDDHAPVYGAGELYFRLCDAPALAASFQVVGATSRWQNVAAHTAFISFAYGALRGVYAQDIRWVYDTRYENLVLAGMVQSDGELRPFFLVSGMHDKGFPWGDGESLWDVLLVVGDGHGGYQRYGITDRALEGLALDVEHGTYRYRGPLFAVTEGHTASFSQMRQGASHLVPCGADLAIDFHPQAYETVSFPFPVLRRLLRRLAAPMAEIWREALPSAPPLGLHLTPHIVTVDSGTLLIEPSSGHRDAAPASAALRIVAAQTFGEAERSVLCNVKAPTLLYDYICAVRPEASVARVQLHTRTLRDEREHWGKDQWDKFAGTVVSRFASGELVLEGDQLRPRRFDRQGEEAVSDALFVKLGEAVLEIHNDHFPTAVLKRNIVMVRDPSGAPCLALEEGMSLMRLQAMNSDKRVTVAAIRNDQDKFAALDEALDATRFETLVEARLAETGKARADFSVVIKPNFMFAYDKRDRTTFTDPDLVGHVVKRLRATGFERIAVVEAQSTYGEYFDQRGVLDMAQYLGFDGGAGYTVVDMTEDALDRQDLGPHLGVHPVSRVWRDADFRISFAKNKTHAYAYYSLTLKNIYGALPLANKFKAYHCDRDIYHTTIAYLSAFPVHFGLVDAYVSADGPFGVFADTWPNPTHTVIGGADLVAVDWVAATKMGIDPMISTYMRLAVATFGKPEIQLLGDESHYRPWLNVPVALSWFAHKGMDADYYFGNLLYTVCAQMDETHFRHTSRAWPIRLLRTLTVPLRRLFFVRTGEDPSWGNRFVSWMLYQLGY